MTAPSSRKGTPLGDAAVPLCLRRKDDDQPGVPITIWQCVHEHQFRAATQTCDPRKGDAFYCGACMFAAGDAAHPCVMHAVDEIVYPETVLP